MRDTEYTNDLALLTNAPTQTKSPTYCITLMFLYCTSVSTIKKVDAK